MKRVEEILSRQLKNYGEKDIQAKHLEIELNRVQQSHQDILSKLESNIRTGVAGKTRQYEVLVKELSLQITKLLYENHKLRVYIQKISGETVLPMHYASFSKDMIAQESDISLYDSMEELVIQNKELRTNLYQMKSASKALINEDIEQHDTTKLLMKLEKAEEKVVRQREELAAWETNSKELISDSQSLKKSLRTLQLEKSNLDEKSKNQEVMIQKLKSELRSSSGQ